MKNFKYIDKRKFLGTIVGTILFSCIAFYFTYARYEWRSADTNVTINFEDVMLEFENGGNVNVSNIGPVLNYTDGVKANFTATSIAGIDFPFVVKLDITSISETLLVESFKYKLMRDTSGGTNYTEEVASGDFSTFSTGENIIHVETMSPTSVYSYQFIVYIDGNMPNDNNMQQNSLVSTLIVTDDDVISDYSGNNNHAVQYGTTFTSDGLYFDGVDDYLMIKELDWNNSTAFTIDFIGKIEDNSELQPFTSILFESSEDSNNNYGSFYINTNEYGTNDLMLAMKYNPMGVNHKIADNIINNSSFLHYTITFDSMKTYNNFINIFINSQNQEVEDVYHGVTGELLAYDVSGETLLNYPFYIGGRGKKNYYSKMTMKELRIYNKALTAEEVSANYQGNPVTDSLLVHYDFT